VAMPTAHRPVASIALLGITENSEYIAESDNLKHEVVERGWQVKCPAFHMKKKRPRLREGFHLRKSTQWRGFRGRADSKFF
jgi:hypothetical protein